MFWPFSYLPNFYFPLSPSTCPLYICVVSRLFRSVQIAQFFCIHCACVPRQSGICFLQSHSQSQASRAVGPSCSTITEIIISTTRLLGVVVVHYSRSGDLFLTMAAVPLVFVACLALAEPPGLLFAGSFLITDSISY